MPAKKVGAKWLEITDVEGAHKDLFEASETVYQTLFPRDIAEEWWHFREYIRDTQERRRKIGDALNKLSKDEVLDHYFVGTFGAKAYGMAFLTTYPKWNLGFISYFGVLKFKNRKALSDRAYGNIAATVRHEARHLIFEIEKFDTIPDADQRRARMATLALFQKRGKARKLAWIDYKQPKLELDDMTGESPDLYLMVAPTSGSDLPATFPRRQAAAYVDFVYNRFYWDGFAVTDEGRTDWDADLKDLATEVLSTVPEEVESIPLVQVHIPSRNKSEKWAQVLISYATEPQSDTAEEVFRKLTEGSRAAELLENYLQDIGLSVTYFERDYLREASKNIADVMHEWVERADLVIFIFTPRVLTSEGVKKELEVARDLSKPFIILMRRDIEENRKNDLRSMVKQNFGNVVTIDFEERTLGEVMIVVKDNIQRILGAVSTGN